MIELYINDVRADLEDKPFNYNLQVNDMFDFDTREVSYSDSIYLPATNINRGIFDFADIPGVLSDGAYTRYRVDYYVNGVPILQGGVGYLIGKRGDYFIFEFKDGSTQLYQFLQDRDIKGLKGLIDEGAKKDFNKIRDTYLNNNNNNIGYYLADYGDDSVDDFGSYVRWNISRAPLAISLNRVFNLVAQEGSFVFSGAIFSSEDWRNLYISSSNIQYDTKEVDALTATNSNGRFLIYPAPRYNLWGFVRMQNGNGYGVQLYVGANQPNVLPYRVESDGYYKVNIAINNIYGEADGMAWFGVMNMRTGMIEKDIRIIDGHTWNKMTWDYSFFAKKGDELYLSMRSDRHSVVQVEGVTFKIEKLRGNEDLNSLVSDLPLVDLFKNVFKMFSLTPIYNNKEGVYNFYTLNERLLASNVLNWSNKFVKVKDINFHSSNYGRKNNFLYKKYNEDSGNLQNEWDSIVYFNDDKLVDRKDFSIVFFAPKNKRSVIKGGVSIERMEFFTKEEKLENGSVKVNYKESTGRWTIFSKRRLDTSVLLTNVLGNSAVIDRVYVADCEGLKWGNLLRNYYNRFNDVLERPYIVTAEFALNEIDIYEFSFYSRIYVDNLNGYFLPNKIKYKAGAVAEVEMVKIN